MARDHKFSGTLPLLAYAPEDFGLRAQRSRAYRAQAAMGRTSVQSMRNHAQAPAAMPAKPVVAEPVVAPETSVFTRLMSRAGGLFRRSKDKAQSAQVKDKAQVVQGVVTRIAGKSVTQPAQIEREIAVKPAAADIARAIRPAQSAQRESASQPVSSTYAAMRLGAAAADSDQQSIPEAPDLAHALVEIREALREHERLARVRLGDDQSA